MQDKLILSAFTVASVNAVLSTNAKVKQLEVGVSNMGLGEVAAVHAELKEGNQTQQQTIDFCGNSIASDKAPRYVGPIGVGGFSTTALGKIQKVVLRERAFKETGLQKDTALE
jgi:acyl-CoA synthetase (AMP-forming)/AMP-acid ligase II